MRHSMLFMLEKYNGEKTKYINTIWHGFKKILKELPGE